MWKENSKQIQLIRDEFRHLYISNASYYEFLLLCFIFHFILILLEVKLVTSRDLTSSRMICSSKEDPLKPCRVAVATSFPRNVKAAAGQSERKFLHRTTNTLRLWNVVGINGRYSVSFSARMSSSISRRTKKSESDATWGEARRRDLTWRHSPFDLSSFTFLQKLSSRLSAILFSLFLSRFLSWDLTRRVISSSLLSC